MAEPGDWQLISLEQFTLPSAPAHSRFQQSWLRLRRVLGLESADHSEPVEQGSLPDYGEFDRRPAIAALDAHLADWRQNGDNKVCFLLAPPFSGVTNIASDWAAQQGWRTLSAPSLEMIEAVDIDGWWQQQQVEGPWLIDDLAAYLLRTASGMRFVRALLPRLLHGEMGQGLLVCNSWMYAFLQRAWPLPLPRVYCFAAAEPGLLRSLGVQGEDKAVQALAARVRGNVGLALAIWKTERHGEQTLPVLPAAADDGTAFVLYALLLHGGLSGGLLQQVLPAVAPDQLDVQLLQLEQAGIVYNDDGRWRVTVQSYLAVRDFLRSRDCWLDAF